MATQDNNLEVAEATETAVNFDSFNTGIEDVTDTSGKFTSEDLAKARAQEKDKLYPVLEKTKEELAELKKFVAEQQAKEAERIARRKAREAELAAEKKNQAEDEMSFKELLKTKETEWQSKIEAERLERERAFALLEREREFQELQSYRQQRLESERDAIMPELLDLVDGNSKDEVEQNILRAKDKTAKILESVQAAQRQTRKEMVGASVTSPTSGLLDNNTDSSTFSPDDIKNMSLQDYAKNRAKYLGIGSNNRGQGLFG